MEKKGGKIEEALAEHLGKVRRLRGADGNTLRLTEISYRQGALDLARHLEVFFRGKIPDEARAGSFTLGTKEGLLWALQETMDFIHGDE